MVIPLEQAPNDYPPHPAEEDISISCGLSDPDDPGVSLIRACGLIPFSCSILDIGLGG